MTINNICPHKDYCHIKNNISETKCKEYYTDCQVFKFYEKYPNIQNYLKRNKLEESLFVGSLK